MKLLSASGFSTWAMPTVRQDDAGLSRTSRRVLPTVGQEVIGDQPGLVAGLHCHAR